MSDYNTIPHPIGSGFHPKKKNDAKTEIKNKVNAVMDGDKDTHTISVVVCRIPITKQADFSAKILAPLDEALAKIKSEVPEADLYHRTVVPQYSLVADNMPTVPVVEKK